MANDGRRQRIVNTLVEGIKTKPVAIAQQYGQPSGTKASKPEDERRLFWQRDPSPQAQPEFLWQQAMQAGLQQGLDEQTIVQMAGPNIMKAMYPLRDDRVDPQTGQLVSKGVVTLGDRALDIDKQKAFVKRMVEQGPPDQEES